MGRETGGENRVGITNVSWGQTVSSHISAACLPLARVAQPDGREVN